MAIRAFLVLALVLGLGGGAWGGPPNVLLILGDDQAWTDYGFMGHPVIKTPHLDRLASSSLTFDRCYVPTSLCRASLASIMTGLWPQDHGITSNDPALPDGLNTARAMKDPRFLADRAKMVQRFSQKDSLVKMLSAAGYRSLQTGKWWEGEACRCGFNEGMTHGDTARGGRHGDEGLKIGRQSLEPCFDFIDRCQKDGKPFFVWYAPMMPHDPHNPPERWLKLYRDKTPSIHVAKYWAMCAWFDETIGQLLEHLKKRDLEKDTIIVYLADNGWIQKTDGPGYAPRSKRSPYDGGLRTPLIVHIPGKKNASRRIATPVSSVDVVPTVLGAVGVPIPSGLAGIDLANDQARENRPFVAGATFTHNAISLDDPARNVEWRWIITKEGKKAMIPHLANTPGETPHLFDVVADPMETKDLIRENPETAAKLKELLDGWWKGPG